MFWIIKKDLLLHRRYKMETFNLYLFPFFLIAPYILLSNYYQIASIVLMNMIIWEWLCQLLFGISDGIGELRIEGTFSNVIMTPLGLVGYLFYKYFSHVLDCVIITITTLLLANLFLGVGLADPLTFVIMCVIFSVSLFAFSIIFAVLVLRYKRVKDLNYFLQQLFGFLSGYTNDIRRFPTPLRFFSFLIPLTYAIIFFDGFYIDPKLAIILLILTIIYLVIGSRLLSKEMDSLRQKGEIEQW